MKILAFSDYRVQDIDLLIQFIKKRNIQPDLILYAGDDIERFSPLPNSSLDNLLLEHKSLLLSGFKGKKRGQEVFVDHISNCVRGFCLEGPLEGRLDEVLEARDIHGCYFECEPENCIRKTVTDGDLTVGIIYDPEDKRNLFENLASLSKYGLCAVIGNDDSPSVRDCIRGLNVYDVQKEALSLGGSVVVGIEGAVDDPKRMTGIGYTLYDEKTLSKYLEAVEKEANGRRLILLSHCPPYQVLDFARRFGIQHIGSIALREFVLDESERVPLIVCGHAHLMGGRNTMLEQTMVVNAASHDDIGAPGRIAIIQLEESVSVEWHQIYGLRSVFGIGPATEARLKDAGMVGVEDIAVTQPSDLAARAGMSLNRASGLCVRAKSIADGRAIPLTGIEFDDARGIYLDIETDLTRSLVWLVGIYSRERDELTQIVARTPAEERSLLEEFVNKMSGFDGRVFTFSGTSFDQRVLLERLDVHNLRLCSHPEFVDLFRIIQPSVALPLKSYGLKSIAAYLGYIYRHPDLDGITVAMHYLIDYQKNRDSGLLKRLLEYNEDDIRSLPWIMERIAELSHNAK